MSPINSALDVPCEPFRQPNRVIRSIMSHGRHLSDLLDHMLLVRTGFLTRTSLAAMSQTHLAHQRANGLYPAWKIWRNRVPADEFLASAAR